MHANIKDANVDFEPHVPDTHTYLLTSSAREIIILKSSMNAGIQALLRTLIRTAATDAIYRMDKS